MPRVTSGDQCFDIFRAAIAVWRQEPQLWIDTEVADWSTPNPRLSLLQVRTATGPNVVVDVLEGSTRQVLDEEFNDILNRPPHVYRIRVGARPGSPFDLGIDLSAQQQSELGSDVEERIRPFADGARGASQARPPSRRLSCCWLLCWRTVSRSALG